MLRFPPRYRPQFFVTCGVILIIFAFGFVEKIPLALAYLIFAHDPTLLIIVAISAITAWGSGVGFLYHGVALWRDARRYKPVAFG